MLIRASYLTFSRAIKICNQITFIGLVSSEKMTCTKSFRAVNQSSGQETEADRHRTPATFSEINIAKGHVK